MISNHLHTLKPSAKTKHVQSCIIVPHAVEAVSKTSPVLRKLGQDESIKSKKNCSLQVVGCRTRMADKNKRKLLLETTSGVSGQIKGVGEES